MLVAGQAPRIVLADDHPELLCELRALLETECAILSTACDGTELVRSAREHRPDVVISDFRMAGMSGIDACRQVLRVGWSRAAILLTMYNDAQLVATALQAGILGYVLKVDAAEELLPAVHKVLSGSVYLSRSIRRKRIE